MSGQLVRHPQTRPTTTLGSANNLRAWLAAILIPEVLIGALFLGEGLFAVLGYRDGETVPLLPAMIISVAVFLAAMIPAALAVLFGRTARREGHRFAIVPVALGLAALAYLVLSFGVVAADQIFN